MSRNGDSAPEKTREFLRYVRHRFRHDLIANRLGTARQHIDKELPKVGHYIVALVGWIGPDAAIALQHAISEGLRQFYLGSRKDRNVDGPISDLELDEFVRLKRR